MANDFSLFRSVKINKKKKKADNEKPKVSKLAILVR